MIVTREGPPLTGTCAREYPRELVYYVRVPGASAHSASASKCLPGHHSTYTHAHTHARTHAHTHAHTHTHTHMHTHMHMHNTHGCTHIHTCTYAHIHVYIHSLTHAHTSSQVGVEGALTMVRSMAGQRAGLLRGLAARPVQLQHVHHWLCRHHRQGIYNQKQCFV